MTSSNDAPQTAPVRAAGRRRRWTYWLLFATQTAGATTIFLHAVPLFRQTVAAPNAFEPHTGERAVWLLPAIALIQIGYWIRYYLNPRLPQVVNAFFGHVLQFLARLIFILATSLFYFLFIARRPEDLNMPDVGIVGTLALLFSLFCYTLEVEHLGKQLLGSREKQ